MTQTVLELRNPKSAEQTPEAAAQFLAALPRLPYSIFHRLLGKSQCLTLEIASLDQVIYFYASVPESQKDYLKSQITSQYPQVIIDEAKDYLNQLTKDKTLACGQLKFKSPFWLPLKTYQEFKDIDPLSSVLGALAKLKKDQNALI